MSTRRPPVSPTLLWLLALASVAGLLGCDDAANQAKMRAAELAGDVAAQVIVRSSDGSGRSADFIDIPIEVRKLNDFVYQARGVANTTVVATSEGHVVFDTGLATQAAKQRRILGDVLPEAPITHVVLSHSHQDHVGGTQWWVEEGTEIVAHEEFSEEQRYLLQLQDYFWHRNRTLFPFMPEDPPKDNMFAYTTITPTIVVGEPDSYSFEQGGVRFEVIPTPGAEGADNVCLWLPEHKILFSGDFFGPLFPQFPNVFTMRGEKVRKPVEYIESLERIIALEPEMIVPSHKDPIRGRESIHADLVKMRDAVRYVHDAVIAGMNGGKTMYELMAEIQLPPELALTQEHGRVSWAVKSIWEYYATWFHFDSTAELYPVPASEVYAEIADLAGVDELVRRARARIEAGEPVHALHLLEIALGADPEDRAGLQTRKAALELLLEQAEPLGNAYELDWLNYRLRATNEALGEDAA